MRHGRELAENLFPAAPWRIEESEPRLDAGDLGEPGASYGLRRWVLTEVPWGGESPVELVGRASHWLMYRRFELRKTAQRADGLASLTVAAAEWGVVGVTATSERVVVVSTTPLRSAVDRSFANAEACFERLTTPALALLDHLVATAHWHASSYEPIFDRGPEVTQGYVYTRAWELDAHSVPGGLAARFEDLSRRATSWLERRRFFVIPWHEGETGREGLLLAACEHGMLTMGAADGKLRVAVANRPLPSKSPARTTAAEKALAELLPTGWDLARFLAADDAWSLGRPEGPLSAVALGGPRGSYCQQRLRFASQPESQETSALLVKRAREWMMAKGFEIRQHKTSGDARVAVLLGVSAGGTLAVEANPGGLALTMATPLAAGSGLNGETAEKVSKALLPVARSLTSHLVCRGRWRSTLLSPQRVRDPYGVEGVQILRRLESLRIDSPRDWRPSPEAVLEHAVRWLRRQRFFPFSAPEGDGEEPSRLLAVSEWGTILVEDDGAHLLVAVANRPLPTAAVDADRVDS